jgi:hypothetical protein
MEGLVGQLVPLVAIVMGVGMAFWSVYWDHQRKRLQYEERRLMIEKGMTPPPLPPDPPRRTLESSLRSGIILVFLGIGLGIAGLLTQANGLSRILAVAASVVLLLGVGNLVYYGVAKGQARSSPTSEV